MKKKKREREREREQSYFIIIVFQKHLTETLLSLVGGFFERGGVNFRYTIQEHEGHLQSTPNNSNLLGKSK